MKVLTKEELGQLPNKRNTTSAPIGNYYGEPYVFVVEEHYYFVLDDHSSEDVVEVSKDFYDAFIKEFPKKPGF